MIARAVRLLECAALLLFLPVILVFAVRDAIVYRAPFRAELRVQWQVWKRGWRMAKRGE